MLFSRQDMEHLAQFLAEALHAGDVVALSGEVGAGKTTFAQALIALLLKTPEPITSPTFTIVQQYETRRGWTLLHADLYRIRNVQELHELGLEEAFTRDVSLIEWPEIAAPLLPEDCLYVSLSHADENHRNLVMESRSVRWKHWITSYEECRV